MNYYIADLHLGHVNVIKFDKRPFENIGEMEAEIIRRWNERVTPNDTVYIIGYFCWLTISHWANVLRNLIGH